MKVSIPFFPSSMPLRKIFTLLLFFEKAIKEIVMGKTPEFREPQKWSEELRDFLSKCLNRDPKARAPADTLLKHPFILKSLGERLSDNFMSYCKQLEKKQNPAELSPSGSLIIPGQPQNIITKSGNNNSNSNHLTKSDTVKPHGSHTMRKSKKENEADQKWGRAKSASLIGSGNKGKGGVATSPKVDKRKILEGSTSLRVTASRERAEIPAQFTEKPAPQNEDKEGEGLAETPSGKGSGKHSRKESGGKHSRKESEGGKHSRKESAGGKHSRKESAGISKSGKYSRVIVDAPSSPDASSKGSKSRSHEKLNLEETTEPKKEKEKDNKEKETEKEKEKEKETHKGTAGTATATAARADPESGRRT